MLEDRDTEQVTLRIMTWDVDGFTNAVRRLEVTKYLFAQKVDIAVLTESHLREEHAILPQYEGGKEKIFTFKPERYKIVDWNCRESEVGRIGRGALIIARP